MPLHVERSGTGPTLVLAHGFAGSARNFRPQARAFADRVHTVLYDMRGHARSSAPEDTSEYTEDALVSDFGSVVEGAGGAAIVGGLSLGAYTALLYALSASTPPKGLLLSAFPSGGATGFRSRWSRDFAEAIERDGLESAGERFVWGETSRFDPKGAQLIRQGFLEHPPHALAALLRNVLSHLKTPDELAERLSSFSAPTLVIVGSEDQDSLGPSHRLAELLPNAELVIVPSAGHVVNLAAPAAFNDALAKLVERALSSS
ncbi:MAG TPA: alpha/beta hydrolase [Polyangiaceae bacterium]|nr:alpha/beta hydrolase [Polyangiaceae bacterium]